MFNWTDKKGLIEEVKELINKIENSKEEVQEETETVENEVIEEPKEEVQEVQADNSLKNTIAEVLTDIIVENVWITKKDKNGNDYKVEIEDKQYYSNGKFGEYLKSIFSKFAKVDVVYDIKDMSYIVTFDNEEKIKIHDLKEIIKDIEKKSLLYTSSPDGQLVFRYNYKK